MITNGKKPIYRMRFYRCKEARRSSRGLLLGKDQPEFLAEMFYDNVPFVPNIGFNVYGIEGMELTVLCVNVTYPDKDSPGPIELDVMCDEEGTE